MPQRSATCSKRSKRATPASGPVLVTCLLPAAARAQETPLSQMLPVLLGNTITLQSSHLRDQPAHIAHFQPGGVKRRRLMRHASLYERVNDDAEEA